MNTRERRIDDRLPNLARKLQPLLRTPNLEPVRQELLKLIHEKVERLNVGRNPGLHPFRANFLEEFVPLPETPAASRSVHCQVGISNPEIPKISLFRQIEFGLSSVLDGLPKRSLTFKRRSRFSANRTGLLN